MKTISIRACIWRTLQELMSRHVTLSLQHETGENPAMRTARCGIFGGDPVRAQQC